MIDDVDPGLSKVMCKSQKTLKHFSSQVVNTILMALKASISNIDNKVKGAFNQS